MNYSSHSAIPSSCSRWEAAQGSEISPSLQSMDHSTFIVSFHKLFAIYVCVCVYSVFHFVHLNLKSKHLVIPRKDLWKSPSLSAVQSLMHPLWKKHMMVGYGKSSVTSMSIPRSPNQRETRCNMARTLISFLLPTLLQRIFCANRRHLWARSVLATRGPSSNVCSIPVSASHQCEVPWSISLTAAAG